MTDLPPLPDSQDPFELLGVDPASSPVSVKRAYLRLVKRYKPESAPEEFVRIREAYELASSILGEGGLASMARSTPADRIPPRREPDRESPDDPSGIDFAPHVIKVKEIDAALTQVMEEAALIPRWLAAGEISRVIDAVTTPAWTQNAASYKDLQAIVVRAGCAAIWLEPMSFAKLEVAYADLLGGWEREVAGGLLVQMRALTPEWKAWRPGKRPIALVRMIALGFVAPDAHLELARELQDDARRHLPLYIDAIAALEASTQRVADFAARSVALARFSVTGSDEEPSVDYEPALADLGKFLDGLEGELFSVWRAYREKGLLLATAASALACVTGWWIVGLPILVAVAIAGLLSHGLTRSEAPRSLVARVLRLSLDTGLTLPHIVDYVRTRAQDPKAVGSALRSLTHQSAALFAFSLAHLVPARERSVDAPPRLALCSEHAMRYPSNDPGGCMRCKRERARWRRRRTWRKRLASAAPTMAIAGLAFSWIQAIPASEGHVTIEYESGDVYVGEIHLGKKHGQGRYVFKNGDVLEGQFENDKMNGRGTYRWPTGAIYEGEFKDGRFHGRGRRVWSNGRTYEGDWVEDKRQGRGRAMWPDGRIYEGEWFDDLPHGHGRLTWGGRTHEGVWERGKAQR